MTQPTAPAPRTAAPAELLTAWRENVQIRRDPASAWRGLEHARRGPRGAVLATVWIGDAMTEIRFAPGAVLEIRPAA